MQEKHFIGEKLRFIPFKTSCKEFVFMFAQVTDKENGEIEKVCESLKHWGLICTL